MPTLRSLLDVAKSSLVAGKADAALDPCRAVIEKYPKHVEASCLLAEAHRELRQLPEATELFERVVSADPENLIGHWGLSTIFEEQGDLDAALYELQIAYDLSPGHPVLRQELMRLRAHAEWPDEELELTSAGLARVYWRGFQYRRAIAEARTALEQAPERLDVALLLCEAQWRVGRVAEAAELAAEVLAESPDCLKANLIRAYGRQDEARKLFTRAARDAGRGPG